MIEIVSKKHRKTRVAAEKGEFICIDTDFLMVDHEAPDRINYIVPYSLHSNYQEMSEFIKSIRPAILRKIVIPYEKFKHVKYKVQINNRLRLSKYIETLEKIGKSKSGYSDLVRRHTDITALSNEYLTWMKEDNQDRLLRALGLTMQPDHSLRKRKVDL